MNINFLLKRKKYNIRNDDYDVQCYNYNYKGKYKFMDKKLMGNLLSYSHVPLFIFSIRKNVVSGILYEYRENHTFNDCYTNKDILPSLPRNIIKDHSDIKLSYFSSLRINELNCAKIGNESVLFINSKIGPSLSDYKGV